MLANAVPTTLIAPSTVCTSDCISAAQRALTTAALSIHDRPSLKQRQDDEIARLVAAVVEPESVALQRAISKVADLKIKEVALSAADTEAQTDESHTAWQAALSDLGEAAAAMLDAPIASASDAVIRAEAFIDAVGRDANDLPEDDSADLLSLLASYRQALDWMAGQTPDRTAWDDTVANLRKTRSALDRALSQEEEMNGGRVVYEAFAVEELQERLGTLTAAYDTQRNALLAMDPPDVGGLLEQMDIVFDVAHLTDVGSYAVRARLLGEGPVTIAEMEAPEANRTRPLALLATNAARLRDRSMPADWQALMASVAPAHRNAADAAHQAYIVGVAAADFSDVHLVGKTEEDRPMLAFNSGQARPSFSTPKGCWRWSPVDLGQGDVIR